MSQVGILSVTATPSVPTSFVTDSGTAVPAANILNVLGGTSSLYSDNGIATSGSGANLGVKLTNRIQGANQTVGAATVDLFTFSMGSSPQVITFDITVAGFESTTPAGAGYNIFGTIRTTGAAATLVGTPDKIVNEEAALTGCDANLVVSGNNAILRMTGTAGLTVSWNSITNYTVRT